MQKSDRGSDASEEEEEAKNSASEGVVANNNAGETTTNAVFVSASLPSESESDTIDPNSTTAALSEDRWEEMFEKLLKFKDMHGHCLVPNRYKEDLQLSAWVVHQRKNYKAIQNGRGRATTMTPARMKRLVDAGFEWTAKNPRHLMWEVRFAELKDFKAQYGHAQVPIGWEQNVQLANWVSTQRQEYKNLIKGKTSRLNERRVQLLDSIGFAWELQRGGRRRRLVVSGEEDEDAPTPVREGVKNADDEEPATPSETFPVEDPNSPQPASIGGRRRTTLKKKAMSANPASSKCILPGVAVLGGGRESQRQDINRRRSSSGGAVRADSPVSGTPDYHQPLSANSNEALLRALGNSNHNQNPYQHQHQMMPPQGTYQQQHPNALAQHLMNATQQQQMQMMAGAQNAYYNMSGQYGMAPYGGNMGGRGMDPPQYSPSNNLVPVMEMQQDMQQHQYGQRNTPETKSMEGGDQQYGGWQGGAQQQAAYWGGAGTSSAAAAAAQHLQAAAALTAGMDERSLPPELAPLASIARRMNMQQQQQQGGGGHGGEFAPGAGGSSAQPNNMMSMGMSSPGSPPQQFQPQHAVRRGRIGDPPADPPSDEAYAEAEFFASGGGKRGSSERGSHDDSPPNNPRKKKSVGGGPFDDADE